MSNNGTKNPATIEKTLPITPREPARVWVAVHDSDDGISDGTRAFASADGCEAWRVSLAREQMTAWGDLEEGQEPTEEQVEDFWECGGRSGIDSFHYDEIIIEAK